MSQTPRNNLLARTPSLVRVIVILYVGLRDYPNMNLVRPLRECMNEPSTLAHLIINHYGSESVFFDYFTRSDTTELANLPILPALRVKCVPGIMNQSGVIASILSILYRRNTNVCNNAYIRNSFILLMRRIGRIGKDTRTSMFVLQREILNTEMANMFIESNRIVGMMSRRLLIPKDRRCLINWWHNPFNAAVARNAVAVSKNYYTPQQMHRIGSVFHQFVFSDVRMLHWLIQQVPEIADMGISITLRLWAEFSTSSIENCKTFLRLSRTFTMYDIYELDSDRQMPSQRSYFKLYSLHAYTIRDFSNFKWWFQNVFTSIATWADEKDPVDANTIMSHCSMDYVIANFIHLGSGSLAHLIANFPSLYHYASAPVKKMMKFNYRTLIFFIKRARFDIPEERHGIKNMVQMFVTTGGVIGPSIEKAFYDRGVNINDYI